MLLPDIKINLNPKAIAIVAAAVGVAGTFVMLGYLIGLQPKEVVCKEYMQELQTSSTQITELEKELSKSKEVHTLSCVAREKDLCAERVKALSENYKRLRCKICESGVR